MKFIFTIIFFTLYNICNSQNNGFNYNNISVPCDSNGKQIYYYDSVVVYHNLYNRSYTCKLYKNGHMEIFDSLNNIVESGLLNFTCSQRCSRYNLWKEFYNSGELKAFGNYKRDQKINIWKYFYKNSSLMRLEDYAYDNDYKFSFDNQYYQSEPFLIAEYEYYENGQLKMEGQYDVVNNCKDSIYEIDLNTGMQKENKIEVEFSCSVKCGTWNYYFPDGSLMKREEY